MKTKEHEDEYRVAFEIKDENAHIIVKEPIISDEEREKRMNNLKEAVKNFWVSHFRDEARKEREKKRGEK